MSETPFANSWYAKQRERAMSARWLGMSFLLLGHGTLDFLLAFFANRWGAINYWAFVSFLVGAATAQFSLIALWAVFVDRPPISRIIIASCQVYAMALAMLFGFQLQTEQTRFTPVPYGWQAFWLTFGLLILSTISTIVGYKLIQVLLSHPRLTLPEQRAILAPAQQITIKHFLRDVAIVCVLMALTRWVLPKTGGFVVDSWVVSITGTVIIFTLAGLALTPALVGICFCPWRWGMLRGTAGLLFWPMFVGLVISSCLDQVLPTNDSGDLLPAWLFCAGVVFSFGVSIAVLRSIGFELQFQPITTSTRPGSTPSVT